MPKKTQHPSTFRVNPNTNDTLDFAIDGMIVAGFNSTIFRSCDRTGTYKRLVSGEPMAGRFVVNDRMPIRQAFDELFLLIDCSKQVEWKGVVLYLPL